jgi:hypothetical protein
MSNYYTAASLNSTKKTYLDTALESVAGTEEFLLAPGVPLHHVEEAIKRMIVG